MNQMPFAYPGSNSRKMVTSAVNKKVDPATQAALFFGVIWLHPEQINLDAIPSNRSYQSEQHCPHRAGAMPACVAAFAQKAGAAQNKRVSQPRQKPALRG